MIAKNAVIVMTPRYRLSTSGASDEACSGKSENPENIKALRVALHLLLFLPPHQENESGDGDNRQHAAKPHQVHHDRAVAPVRGIIVIAIEQQLVDERPDMPLPRFEQREPQLLWRVLDAVEIA